MTHSVDAIAGLLIPSFPVSMRPANRRLKLAPETLKSYQFELAFKLTGTETLRAAGIVRVCTPIPEKPGFGVTVTVFEAVP